jgi:MarR family transcriptional regulator, transcriptional regulator for hemolysin
MVAARMPSEPGLGFIIGDISRLARKEFDRRVRDLRLTRAQWLFLYHLAQQPGCTQSDLAERLQMEKITISRQAGRLVRAGWIERRDHADDGRAYHLHVTRKARPIIARLTDRAAQMRTEYFDGVSPARRTALLRDLQRIKSNLLRMDAEAKRRTS